MEEAIRKDRIQSLGEEIGNAITHGVGALFAIVASIFLFIKANTTLEYIGVAIYGFCMLMLYLMSCLYHAFKNGSKVKRLFRLFDHTSIFLLIGGTYAPILLCALPNKIVGYTFFSIQWTLIAIGIVFKCLIKTKTAILHTVLCCILGWSGIIILPYMYQIDQVFFWLILGGGIAYMLGIFFFASKFKYAHFVWHFFVIFGTLFHFVAIYLYVL